MPAATMRPMPQAIVSEIESEKKRQLNTAENGMEEKPRQDERSILPEA